MAKIPKPHFNLKNPKSKTKSLIYLIFVYQGRRVKHSTGSNIKVSEWDHNRQRPMDIVRRPDLWALKRQLDDLEEYTKSIYVDHDYGQLTPTQFKEELEKRIELAETESRAVHKNGRKESQSNRSGPDLFEFIEMEVAEMEASNMKWGSLKTFKLHAGLLKEFVKKRGYFTYEDVNWQLRLQLVDWLTAKKVSLAYGNKTLSILSQFMERAKRKGLHTHSGYQGRGWRVGRLKAEGTKVTLNMEELDHLSKMELGGMLKKTRDLFLVGVGSGQRFSDFSRLQPEDFYKTIKGIPILSTISQKTGTPAKIPLNIFPWLVPILEEYEYYAPSLSMQKFNEGLKDLSKKAGFEQKVLVVEQYFGRNPRLEKRFVPKYEMISSHTCRRTFATNLYRLGYSLAQIMPMTGHSTESQLKTYIGIDAEENAEAIALSIAANRSSNSFITSKTVNNVSL